MHIALIHFRLLLNGGLETRLQNYIRTFREMGHRVSVITFKVDPAVPVPEDVAIYRVDLKRVPKPLRMLYFSKGVNKILQQQHFDLSFSLGRTYGQDIVLCPGTHLGFMRNMGIRIGTPADWLNTWLDRKTYATAKLILAASGMMRDEMVDFYGVPESKIRILYPPADTTRFSQVPDETRQKLRSALNIAPEEKVILFLTTGNTRKGLPLVLDIARLLPPGFRVLIAGMGKVRETSQNVHFLGYVPDVERLHRAADVLLHPALYEPFGQVVTESMLCGTPVVVSRNVGASEILQPGEGYVLDTREPEMWCDAVIQAAALGRLSSNVAERMHLDAGAHCRKILEWVTALRTGNIFP